jgi:predicted transcriptional regulator YdeE
MSFYGDPFGTASAWDEENEIGALWKRFMAFMAARPGAIPGRAGDSGPWYEVHVKGPEAARTGRFEVFVGVEAVSAASLSGLPPLLSAKSLPEAEQAVLTLKGEEISADWEAELYRIIIPGMGREADESICVDVYDERFKGMDRLSESELEIWIPLLPALKA